MNLKRKILICLMAATMAAIPLASNAYTCPSARSCHSMCPLHRGGSSGGGGSAYVCPSARSCHGMCPLHR